VCTSTRKGQSVRIEREQTGLLQN